MLRAFLRKMKIRAVGARHKVQRSVASVSVPAPKRERTYNVALPEGYPAREIAITISVPVLPPVPKYHFSHHAMDEDGTPTDTVITVTTGGIGISHDLGRTWRDVRPRGYDLRRFVHAMALGGNEYLVQVRTDDEDPFRRIPVEILVIDENGTILATERNHGPGWHSCRAVAQRDGTLMYAEYPSNKQADEVGWSPARVWRSRDRGRSWAMAYEQTDGAVRHFHYLQPRPGVPREWWLTSGDEPAQSKIWVTKDDGDTWSDITASLPAKMEFEGFRLARDIFRLTDIAWLGDEILWGTDDYFPGLKADSGSRVFRSPVSNPPAPRLIGRCKWPVRNVVDIGDFIVILVQGSNKPRATSDDRRGGVFLAPKVPVEGAPEMVHLFDLERYPVKEGGAHGFTFSKASARPKDGTFFTFRASTDAFPGGHQILEWNVRLS